MPSSTTPMRCAACRRSRVCGTPIALFRLPRVAKAASPACAARMLATICVTVVLPLLPVTAISGRLNWLRHPAASAPRATSVSGTSMPGRPAAAKPPWATAATAPAARAWGRKSWASKRSPLRATNRSPGWSVRVSVCTRTMGSAPSPTRRACGTSAAIQAQACCSVIVMRHLPGALSAPGAPAPCRRTGGARPVPLGSPRGPCPQSRPRR